MRYLQSRRYQFVIHPEAKKDLDDLFNQHQEIAAEILVLFEAIQSEQDCLDRLTSRGYCQTNPWHLMSMNGRKREEGSTTCGDWNHDGLNVQAVTELFMHLIQSGINIMF